MGMKLYKIELPTAKQPGESIANQPLMAAMIVAASSEKDARDIAQENARSEGRRAWARATVLQIGETLNGMMRGVYLHSTLPVGAPAS